MGEAMQELRILEDNGTVCGSAAAQARYTTVDVRARGNLDVADRQSESSEYLPHRHTRTDRLHPLTCAYAPNALVLEARKDVWE